MSLYHSRDCGSYDISARPDDLRAHFILYAILALLNHTAYDVQFRFWGFEYTTRAHETHHRYPTKNLAQYFMFWDKLYGTYKEYYDGADRKKVA